ncbi:hypothetical protein AB0I00_37705 [Streptomyces sp. NPDC050803]|uniref:hypothetical protein n=1 Tax=unclassified Streptomyces TaxID=2593676 RepID=UPI00342B9FF3
MRSGSHAIQNKRMAGVGQRVAQAVKGRQALLDAPALEGFARPEVTLTGALEQAADFSADRLTALARTYVS